MNIASWNYSETVDDEYIVQALQPWKKADEKIHGISYREKSGLLAFIVMLGLCLAFHDQVYADC